jgi:hypothetical protein
MYDEERPNSRSTLPSRLEALVRELKLGELEHRFGYRPGILGAVFSIYVLWVMVPMLIQAVAGKFGEFRGVLIAVSGLSLCAVAWHFWRVYVRFKGGVYIFTGGIAEAYGNKVKKVFTWKEVQSVTRSGTLTTLNSIPFMFERHYIVAALRDDLGLNDYMQLHSTLVQFHHVALLIESHAARARQG